MTRSGTRTGLMLLAALAAWPVEAEEALSLETANAATYPAEIAEGASPAVLKAQVMLDRAGASPGVIDGVWGENVGKAVRAFETMLGLEADGKLDEEVWVRLEELGGATALTEYTITEKDVAGPFVEAIPEDYKEKSELECSCYTSPAEMLAERFHMDVDLLQSLNPDADFAAAGTKIVVADVGEAEAERKVARLEADKAAGQLRGYDETDMLVVAYPATIGSEQTPSPSGTHEVTSVAPDAAYYYRPDVNFQQGENTEPLTIPPGPNNPVGSVWIDLSEPTFGIHGTPEPSKIDKTSSHGCVRLTNWDVEELAKLVKKGVEVRFTE